VAPRVLISCSSCRTRSRRRTTKITIRCGSRIDEAETEDDVTRLAGALPLEQNDEWQFNAVDT